MMNKGSTKRIFCLALTAAMLLCGCGRRGAPAGDGSAEKASAAVPAAKTASGLEIRSDSVIQGHLRSNSSLSTERNVREADTLHFYIENTETMEGFVSPNVTTDFKESIQSLMDVAYNSFPQMDAHMLVYSDDIGELEWERTDLDKKFIRKLQNPTLYHGNTLPEVSPLEALTWEAEDPFEENGLTVIVSNFVEPGNDLNALAVEIESYFDKYENSSACLMGITSRFEGTFHIPSDGGKKTTYCIQDFSGDAPFYMVMVGPEDAVNQTAQNLADRLRTKGITPAYSIYSNNVYAQILAEPLNFDVIGDLKSKKAPSYTIRSFNTGELYEDDAGNAYYSASLGRVETLDSTSHGNVSTSTQISVMSKDYDGVSEYNWDFDLYTYDEATKQWTEAGKNALARTEVAVQTEQGMLTDELSEEPILASGRKEIRVSARLDFGSGSPLSRNQIYRAEVRLYLNRENTEAASDAAGSGLREYSIVRADYDAAVNKLSSGWGGSKIWTASPALQKGAQEVLLKTPNLGDLLTSLEQLESKYQDNSEMIEYIDFVFNVPAEDA